MPHALFIDDSRDKYAELRNAFADSFPDVKLGHYSPSQSKVSIKRYNWRSYKFILVHKLVYCENEEIKEWLRFLQNCDDSPPIIVICNQDTDDSDDIVVAPKTYHLTVTDNNFTPLKEEMINIATEHKFELKEKKSNTVLLFSEDKTLADSHGENLAINQPLGKEIDIPGYEIMRILGKGSMSRVFLAKSLEYNTKVALKVMFAHSKDDIKFLRQFMQEYQLLSNIKHPNIVAIHERGFARDFAYIAMEYYPKGSLRNRLSKNGIRLDLALDYLEQITSGLSEAHKMNIIHRDIKPANVLFKTDHVLGLSDFGIARDMAMAPGDEGLKNMIVGTPHYMSPEQGIGDEIDERSDLYSLGVIFYEMLIGKKPFVASSVSDIIVLHAYAPTPQLRSELSVCQSLMDGLLAKDPNERFLTAEDFLAGIQWIKSKL